MQRFLKFVAPVLILISSAAAQKVAAYQTTNDLSQKIEPQPALTFSASGTAAPTISVDASKTYQQVEGFGASFTDSSAWLIYNKLTADQRADVMQKLFDRTNGIALSFLRQPMGASDEALTFYTYDDMPAGQRDPTLAHFSIDHDRAYIIPVLQQALSINPAIKIMATPWSPPAWMKTTDSLLGTVAGIDSHLKSDAFGSLAQYFVKYIQAYEAEGIKTDYVSMQNEPQYAPPGYTGMIMSAQDQITFLSNNLAPAFGKAGIKTKVLVWDHNWDAHTYAITVLKDATANSHAAGSAFHHYAGDPSAMSLVHDMFPDKDIWETEASGGDWESPNTTASNMADEARELIDVMRNWARSYVLWNMALDQDHGPYATTPDGQHGCNNCRPIVTVNWDNSGAATPAPSTIKYEVDYYVLGQASKFLQPGAYRIYSDQATASGIYDVAFRNPDGSVVLYVFNSGRDQSFNVKYGSKYITAQVKSGAIETFVW